MDAITAFAEYLLDKNTLLEQVIEAKNDYIVTIEDNNALQRMLLNHHVDALKRQRKIIKMSSENITMLEGNKNLVAKVLELSNIINEQKIVEKDKQIKKLTLELKAEKKKKYQAGSRRSSRLLALEKKKGIR